MRTCSETTKAQVAAMSAKPTKPAWMKLALYDALNDKPMSEKRERRMCAWLNIEAPAVLVSVHPCPSCEARGIVKSHADGLDCHSNGGHAIVLAPGETVRRPAKAKRRRPVRRPWMGAELTAAMDAAGMTDEDVRQIVAREVAGRAPGMEGIEVQL